MPIYNGWSNRATWNANLWLANDKANARLIAAAPDLLEAAHWVLALIDGGEEMPKPGDDVTEALRAAVIKAQGRD